MGQVYTTSELGRHGFRKAIEAIKEAVPIETYAAEHTELRQAGKELRGRCLIHGGDNPTSFCVNTERQRFRCFSCGERGDLIDLCEAIERHVDPWTAVVSLAMRYNVALPEKPESWRRWQDQKAEIRAFNEQIRRRRRLRRWFRIFHRDDLAAIADPEERRIETERCWRELERWMPRSEWWGAA